MASCLFKAGIIKLLHFKHIFILLVMVIPCILVSVYFYINMYEGRPTIIKDDRRGDDTKTPKPITNGENRKSNSTGTSTYTRKKRLPECLIIGVKKGGTEAVCQFLNYLPNIACGNTERHFFNKDNNFNLGLEHYRNQMPYSYPDQITVEKTPNYFTNETAVKRILTFNKKIKLILTLRHPVKRLISDYYHEKRMGYKQAIIKRFEELVINESGGVNLTYRPVNESLYCIHLKMWLKYFPKEQIHIVDGDNFIDNPVEEIDKMEAFLGIPHTVMKDHVFFNQTKGFYCHIGRDKRECLRSTKGHVFDPIDPELYHKLLEFYKGYNEKLFALLGRTFKWDSE